MGVSDTEAFILTRTALGEVADLTAAGVDAIVSGAFLRHVLLGLPIGAAVHAGVRERHEDYPAPDHDAPALLAAPGLRLSGAVVTGALDLSDCIGQGGQGLPALALEDCVLNGDGDGPDLDLSHARLARLSLKGSRVGLIRGRDMVVDGPVDLTDLGPRDASDFLVPQPSALDAARAWIEAEAAPFIAAARERLGTSAEPSLPTSAGIPTVPFDADASCRLDLAGSRVAGRMTLDGLRLRAPSAGGVPAVLDLSEAEIGGGLTAARQIIVQGGLDLTGARISHDLDLTGCVLMAGGGTALSARGVSVGGRVLLNTGMIGGLVDFSDARLGANLELSGVLLEGRDGQALTARNARIEGDLVMSDGTVALGRVDLDGVVAGFLHLSQVRILGMRALDVRHAVLAQVEMPGDCVLVGEVSLAATEVRADVLIVGATLIGRRGQWGLDMEGARIGSRLILRDGLTLTRGIHLRSVDVADALMLRGAAMTGLAFVSAIGLSVGGTLTLRELSGVDKLDLTDASCGTLDDHVSAYSGLIHLFGLTYLRLASPAFSTSCVRDRAGWLSGSFDPDHTPRAVNPQPYQQLSRVLAAQGQAEDARDIQVLLADRQRAEARTRIWSGGSVAGLGRLTLYLSTGLFGRLFGHGLKPTRAVATLAVSLILGWAFFSWAHWRGAMVIDQQAVASIAAAGGVGAPRTADGDVIQNIPCGDDVRPSLYALDVFIPLVDLLQETECEIGAAQGVDRAFPLFRGIPLGQGPEARTLLAELEAYRFLKAFYAIAGWLILSLSILTFSGVMQRSGEAG